MDGQGVKTVNSMTILENYAGNERGIITLFPYILRKKMKCAKGLYLIGVRLA